MPCYAFLFDVLFDVLQLLAKEPASKDPKAVTEKNQAVRSNLRALEENWKELDSAYQAEKNKRRVCSIWLTIGSYVEARVMDSF